MSIHGIYKGETAGEIRGGKSGGRGERVTNLDGIEPKPSGANLVDNPLPPFDEVSAGFGMAVVDVCSHYVRTSKEYTLAGRYIITI
jgi:hypothetical protein